MLFIYTLFYVICFTIIYLWECSWINFLPYVFSLFWPLFNVRDFPQMPDDPWLFTHTWVGHLNVHQKVYAHGCGLWLWASEWVTRWEISLGKLPMHLWIFFLELMRFLRKEISVLLGEKAGNRVDLNVQCLINPLFSVICLYSDIPGVPQVPRPCFTLSGK